MDASSLARLWRASARGKSLSRDDLSTIDLAEAASFVRDADLPLRAEGHLMYGLSQIWVGRAAQLLADSQATDESIGSAFREYLAALAGAEPGVSMLDFSLDELPLPSILGDKSIVAPAAPAAAAAAGGGELADADLSIDNIMRGNDAALDPAETAVRSAQDTALLEGLDFGIDLPELEPQGPDFGGEIAYSSSPPHTPLGFEAQDVGIVGPDGQLVGAPFDAAFDAAAPPPKRQKRGGAPVDAVTTLRIRDGPPPAAIRRPLPPIRHVFDVPTSDVADGEDEDWTDAETRALLDPAAIAAEKLRRREQRSQESLNQYRSEQQADAANAALPGDVGDVGDVEMELEPLAFDDTDFGLEESDEEEVTEEMLEAEQREAQARLKQQLGQRGQAAAFDELADTRRGRACMLLEVLSLAAKGRVRVAQAEAFGPARLTRV